MYLSLIMNAEEQEEGDNDGEEDAAKAGGAIQNGGGAERIIITETDMSDNIKAFGRDIRHHGFAGIYGQAFKPKSVEEVRREYHLRADNLSYLVDIPKIISRS